MRWFAKWFGGRSDQDDEQPARVAPAASRPVAPARRMQTKVGAKASPAGKQVNRGFDPYNSGSFDRNQAWNRVIR